MKNILSLTRTMLLLAVALSLSLSGALAQSRTTARPESAAKVAEAGKTVNINQATAEQLTTINGVGPVMAQRIVEFRQKNGAFKKVEDLLSVKGIGEKKLDKMRGQISL